MYSFSSKGIFDADCIYVNAKMRLFLERKCFSKVVSNEGGNPNVGGF